MLYTLPIKKSNIKKITEIYFKKKKAVSTIKTMIDSIRIIQ